MKNIRKKQKKGFTLIEMVVVTAAIGMVMVAVISVVVATFRSQNQSKSNIKVSSGGAWILDELKRNVLLGSGESIVCAENNQSITITSISDGEEIVINCDEDSGAITANSNNLNSGDITISNCSSFVNCTTLPSLEVSEVVFEFTVDTETSGIESSQDFDLSVSVRN